MKFVLTSLFLILTSSAHSQWLPNVTANDYIYHIPLKDLMELHSQFAPHSDTAYFTGGNYSTFHVPDTFCNKKVICLSDSALKANEASNEKFYYMTITPVCLLHDTATVKACFFCIVRDEPEVKELWNESWVKTTDYFFVYNHHSKRWTRIYSHIEKFTNKGELINSDKIAQKRLIEIYNRRNSPASHQKNKSH